MTRPLVLASLLFIVVFAVVFAPVLRAGNLAPPPGYKPDKKIKRLFEAKCATCHGDDGRAKTEEGLEMGIADMTKAAYWKDLTLEKAREEVLEGIKRTVKGKEQVMKPFKDRLSPDQVEALIIYAASLKK
jgi:mono/diheme cytochrome c family protein